MLWIVISAILFVAVLMLLSDYADTFITWLGRIKIGTLHGNEWEQAVRKVIIKWLTKGTPKVPLDDRKRMKIFSEHKASSKIMSVCYWQDAAILKAAASMPSEEVEKGIHKLVSKYIDISSGNWKVEPNRIDSAMLAYEILDCSYIDNTQISSAMNTVAENLLRMAQTYGTAPYNENIPDVRFVDTIGMICPFLIKYAIVYDKPEYIDIAVSQIKEYYDYGVHKELKIPVHCFSKSSKAPMGIYGWGRGCAWWAVGLTDSLKALLSCEGRNTEKVFLLNTAMEFMGVMQNYIAEDGSVSRVIFTQSLQDSSAAAMLAYCYNYFSSLAKSEEFSENSNRIIAHLADCTRRNGVIDYSQGDTRGIGFYSDSLGIIPAAQGFAVATDNLRIYEGDKP